MNLEPKDNQAIRDEIGDRLRVLLSRKSPAVPPRLLGLVRRFDEAKQAPADQTSPSIVHHIPSGFTKVFETRVVKGWLNRLARASRSKDLMGGFNE
jgi:hypothetical protein